MQNVLEKRSSTFLIDNLDESVMFRDGVAMPGYLHEPGSLCKYPGNETPSVAVGRDQSLSSNSLYQ
jgi:hypothetical protein